MLPNDGTGWFGPDTTEGATAPGQYGSPYTKTIGVQEGINYAKSFSSSQYPTIFLQPGQYVATENILVSSELVISGSGNTNQTVVQLANSAQVTWASTSTRQHNLQLNNFVIVGDTSNAISPVNLTQPETSTGIILSRMNISTNQSVQALIMDGNEDSILYGVSAGSSGGNTIQWLIPYGGGLMLFVTTNNLYISSLLMNIDYSVIGGYLLINNCPSPSFIHINTNIAGNATLNSAVINFLGGDGGNGNPVYLELKGYIQIPSTSAASQVMYCDGTFTPSIEIGGTWFINSQTSEIGMTNDPSEYIFINAQHAIYSNIYSPFPPTLSTNPPVSGTAYQNTNPYDIRLKIPVTYSPTSSAAATLATGTSSTSTVTTSTKVSYPAGITTGIIDTYEMVVKAGQYFELVATNATIGTAEVQAA